MISLKNISKSFGSNKVISNLNLEVQKGEFLVLVGPSGCGKSTALRMIAGLEEPSGGQVFIDGRDVTQLPPKDRDIAMVFQSYALYPHLSVKENMGFALKMAKVPQSEIDKRVGEAASILKLEDLLARKPKELSGGQRQRVAVGRAIVRKPKVFLFDEPLSNLDAKLRNEMRVEIKRLHHLLGNTMVYVTHDQIEATTMGDRIAVLESGNLQQIDTPRKVYDSPSNRFVAGFVGSPEMNFIKMTDASERGYPKGAILGVRPEHCVLSSSTGASSGGVAGKKGVSVKVEVFENLGGITLVHGVLDSAQKLRFQVPSSTELKVGQTVDIEFTKSYFFNEVSGARIV